MTQPTLSKSSHKTEIGKDLFFGKSPPRKKVYFVMVHVSFNLCPFNIQAGPWSKCLPLESWFSFNILQRCNNIFHPAQYKLCSLNLPYCSHMLEQNNLLVPKFLDFGILLTFARIWKIIISIITLITSKTNNQSFACTLTSSFVTNKSRRTILVTITFCKKEKFQLVLKILNFLTKILLNHWPWQSGNPLCPSVHVSHLSPSTSHLQWHFPVIASQVKSSDPDSLQLHAKRNYWLFSKTTAIGLWHDTMKIFKIFLGI